MKLMTCYLDDDDGKSYPEKLQEIFFRIMNTRSKTSLFRLTLLGFPTVIRSIGRSKTLFPEGGQDFKQECFLKEQNRHFVQRGLKDLGLSHRLCPWRHKYDLRLADAPGIAEVRWWTQKILFLTLSLSLPSSHHLMSGVGEWLTHGKLINFILFVKAKCKTEKTEVVSFQGFLWKRP